MASKVSESRVASWRFFARAPKGALRRTAAMGLMLSVAVGCGADSTDSSAEAASEGAGKSTSTATKHKDAGTTSSTKTPSKTTPTNTDDSDDTGATSDDTTPAQGSSTTGTGTKANDTPAATGTGYCAVQAISDKHCTACHDGKGTGGSPMGLVKHADYLVAAKSDSTKKVFDLVGSRVHSTKNPMPPKGGLSDDELKTIDAWVAAGAPDGSCDSDAGTANAPSADGRVDGWNPDECDEIYEIRAHGAGGVKDPYVVPKGQEIHPQITIDAPWGNEKIQAIAFKPITDNSKVLHHWILNGGGAFLVGWAPGDDGRPPFPKDVGMDMPTGAGSMTLDMHYFNLMGTSDQPDNSGVQVCALKQAHFRKNLAAVALTFASIGSGGVLAPAGKTNYDNTSTCTIQATSPVHLLTAAPHAHKYAVHMKFTVTKKDGTVIVMHDKPFAFGEQGTYPLAGGEQLLETGDVVTTTCTYTNTTNKDITFGESTTNEMCFNFALYYPKGGYSCGGGGLPGLGGGLTGIFGGN